MPNENGGKKRILITDDEPLIRRLLHELLSENYDCAEAASAEEALIRLEKEDFNLVISDIQMSGISGLEMLPRAREIAPDTIVVMISGGQNFETGIEAMRLGAFDYITKPFSFDQVEAVVKRAVEHQSLLLTKKLYEAHLEELVIAKTKELHEQIVERQRAEEKISRLAYYDSLTMLPNPALFRNRLTHELYSTNGGGEKSAIILLALDRFKNINDTLGHKIGDELLRAAARRLTGAIRQSDTAAYFGGAEFALHLTKVGGVEDVVKIAGNIKNVLLSPFNCGGHELFVTASLGISLSPDDGGECQTLLQNAGTALYRARQKGGDTCRFFTTDMHELAFRRLSLENDLRRALERDELVLYYQPKVDAKTREFSGMEALVRWQHPRLGLVPPNDFIPIAEDTGLIIPLGEWVLRTACRQNKLWQRAGLSPRRISVNLSGRQFQDENLVESIHRTVVETEFPPEFLELEITESSIMNNSDQAVEILNRLRRLGVKISLDDFGSGYSSLAHLKTLPIDVIKIDRAFVRNVSTDTKDVAIIKTIVTLARNLQLKTIVEGVETEEQAAALSNLGCDDMQGFLFSKPIPADALEIMLREAQMKNSFRAYDLISVELP